MGLLFVVVLLLVLAIVIRSLAPKLKVRASGQTALAYQAAALMTPAEVSLYRCLLQVFGTVATVCPKVRLADIIHPHSTLSWGASQSALNRISRKHVDFVIIRSDDFSVIGIIELDDRSHDRKDRADRDIFVDDALRMAAIPMCRIKARSGYDLEVLCTQINQAFAPTTGP